MAGGPGSGCVDLRNDLLAGYLVSCSIPEYCAQFPVRMSGPFHRGRVVLVPDIEVFDGGAISARNVLYTGSSEAFRMLPLGRMNQMGSMACWSRRIGHRIGKEETS